MDASLGGLGNRLSKLRQPSFFGAGGGNGGVMMRELFLPLPHIQFGTSYFEGSIFDRYCHVS